MEVIWEEDPPAAADGARGGAVEGAAEVGPLTAGTAAAVVVVGAGTFGAVAAAVDVTAVEARQ